MHEQYGQRNEHLVAVLGNDGRLFEHLTDVSVPGTHEHLENVHDPVWLERKLGQSSTIDRHSYCTECGSVREIGSGARPIAFFVQGIANLVDAVERRRLGKITQAEARLMVKRLCECKDIMDAFSTTLDIQLDRYRSIVHVFRPGMPEDVLVHSLFRRKLKKSE